MSHAFMCVTAADVFVGYYTNRILFIAIYQEEWQRPWDLQIRWLAVLSAHDGEEKEEDDGYVCKLLTQ